MFAITEKRMHKKLGKIQRAQKYFDQHKLKTNLKYKMIKGVRQVVVVKRKVTKVVKVSHLVCKVYFDDGSIDRVSGLSAKRILHPD